RVKSVLTHMKTVGLDLPHFLNALSWGDPACTSDDTVRFTRTGLFMSEKFPQILRRWAKPP
ncbi:hypothetical protein OF83DRAFT_1018302, partial [Amylostereum chailletii]